MHRSRITNGRSIRLALALAALLSLGCGSLQIALSAGDFSGQVLPAREGRGAERLKAEIEADSAIAAYVREHGKPDYLYLPNRRTVYLLHARIDRAAKFDRVLVEASTLTELGRIPGSLLKLLPKNTRDAITAQRKSKQRRAQARARTQLKKKSVKRARTIPAARAPSSGTYIGGFEVEDIVDRMRQPLTAADPGVSNWRKSKEKSGLRFNAKSGRARFEVASERVVTTVPMSASRAQLPGSARIAIQRVNNAIFGAKADSVTQKMLVLAKRAAADRSGRTAFSQRVAGRTIRIARRPGNGVLAYSVHP